MRVDRVYFHDTSSPAYAPGGNSTAGTADAVLWDMRYASIAWSRRAPNPKGKTMGRRPRGHGVPPGPTT